ncbi:ATP-dependent Lon protease [Lewinella marina]|uniref:Lon protease n=1 Tax=Neolewinella marina TaxID=438751 RepID=A0A2G0CG47_9BACT|nr:endopeptidase La [Neolewinella marina]NJB86595.1 ATP-dependent Lon protease [Neolewinella marina]PHK98954.1 endopeptidase La [Neolewinella marina]
MDKRGIDEDPDMLPFLGLEDGDEELVDGDTPSPIPILALKNAVLFPTIVTPINIGRDRSINAVNKAAESNRLVAVFAQRDLNVEEPEVKDLYEVGTLARILKMLRMPDGSLTAVLRGGQRVRRTSITQETPYMAGTIEPLEYGEPTEEMTFQATVDSIRDMAVRAVELSPNIPTEARVMLDNINRPSQLLNFIASNLNAEMKAKQQLLETNDLAKKAEGVLNELRRELHILELRDQIENKTRGDIEQQQRQYFLNQQIKAIQDELGENPNDQQISELEARAEKKQWPKEVAQTFDRELVRLKRMNPQVAEFSVQLSYLEMLLDLPWQEYTEDNFDLKSVAQVLDNDHYGLEKIKDRILGHLAVLKLKGDMTAPILMLLGPPGVGKTSLGKSIAHALGRKFVRISLGGLHDESEIRGHRKTYIGAMPGRIVQSLRKVGSANPVFILDEIDKIGQSHRGDPSSALLEVLDPEQNSTFHDNYLDLDVDLSKVLFIATANSLQSIQPALRDRMEIIRLSGYSTEEKLEIAKRHLVPKQREAHGLKARQVKIPVTTLREVIDGYTRESGVRSLDRQIAGLMRHAAKGIAMEGEETVKIDKGSLEDVLGPRIFEREPYRVGNQPGIAIGLAWTQVGGEILFVEASLSPGKGSLQQTGNLGTVMKESATTARSYLRANAAAIGIEQEALKSQDLHLHVPEGATPKDGPSAGITMLTAMASAFTNRPIRPYLAMSGEITLRGRVLPVGGIKEKLLAARRAGMKQVILSRSNERHVREVEERYLKGLEVSYVDNMLEVLELALMPAEDDNSRDK